jgi:hypothetical protein
MQSLFHRDQRACVDVCPLPDGRACRSLCAKAAAINAYNERGKLFNVPFRAPPISDLDTGTSDEEAWAALGQRAFSRQPWRPAGAAGDAFAATAAAVGLPPPLPSLAERPADCPASSMLPGTFYGWNQVPDGLWQRTFVPSTDQQFARAVDLNQAMAGYLIDPVLQLAQDGPLSSLKPTMGNSAGQLPQAQPFAGIGFNLSQNVPRSGVANVRGVPTLFEPAAGGGVRSPRLADLSA